MPALKLPEFITIAIRDEETGEAFYNALAEHLPDAGARQAFAKIAAQEHAHAERFRAMLAEAGSYAPAERYGGEYEGYLSSMLEMRAFSDPKTAAAKGKAIADPREAIEIALRMEKDTLLFYLELLEFLPEAKGRAIGDIIAEERMHVNQLTALLHRR